MDDAYRHCEALVREADKERYLASLFVPADRRPHVLALYAFNVEITRIRAVAREPLPGEMRLQWWRDALAGQGHGAVSGHPVAAALIDTIDRFDLPRATLVAMIDAHVFDLYDEPMATMAELQGYLRDTSSAVIDLAAGLLRPFRSAELARAIEAGGIAYGLTAVLRAFPVHARRGQIYLPKDLLDRHGVAREDVTAGRAVAGLSSALAELRAEARRHLQDSGFLRIGGAVADALLPLTLVTPWLRRLQRQDRAPFAVVELPQWRIQWILWRAARRAR